MSEKNDTSVTKNRPLVSIGHHPIETGQYVIPTKEILKVNSVVKDWVVKRASGGIIYGRPRIGKSQALKYMMEVIPRELGDNLPILKTRCRKYKIPSEDTFFEHLLEDFGHGFPSIGKANKKRSRVSNFLIEKGEKSGLRRVIVFIDEAQRLVELQYDWLMDIYNDLNEAGISMTVILIGQKELLSIRTTMLQQKKAQIIGRFMTKEYEFSGVKSVDEIKTCLTGYDNFSEFPEKSGWSFTRYFFPEAFENGEKLSQFADTIINVFIDIRREHGLSKNFEIPMQYLTLSIEIALKTSGAHGHSKEWLTVNDWRNAVLGSGYVESEIYMALV
ncbi:AAA family ATPase [Paenibacillus sp. LMG 31456]|uniref:AAA family ATPase n=1 Tax=Paenibacillus foliorum TaxID=2654974 RepID=A0A972GTT0_9BACL|nr:ATP-binding protein [Paenibacillus foliorum]NOU96208.1 AAA family ATPase [Paenibacillus foliorum]